MPNSTNSEGASHPPGAATRHVDLLYAVAIASLHLVVATAYVHLAGVTMCTNAMCDNWDWFWQALPLESLRTDLGRSLWYLHAQPPLFNLYGGLLAKLFYPHHLTALHAMHIVLGAWMSGMLYVLVRHVTSRRSTALIWAGVLSLNPSMFLYEAYILYTLPSAFLVVLNLWCLWWHRAGGGRPALVAFVGSLNLLILTRSLYHIILIPLALVFLWFIASVRVRRSALLVCVVISSLTLGVYVKNYAVFGFFGSSSWAGMGLWKIVSAEYSREEITQLAADGKIDPMMAERRTFLRPPAYRSYGYEASSPVEVLSRDDMNNVNIPAISACYGRNALRLIGHAPDRYLHRIWVTYRIYCRPSSWYPHLANNTARMRYHEMIYADIAQGATIFAGGMRDYGSVVLVLLPLACILYVVQFLRGWRSGRESLPQRMRTDPVLLWCFLLVTYTTLVSCMFEYGENLRFRFLVEQPMWVFIPAVLCRAWPHRDSTSGSDTAPPQ